MSLFSLAMDNAPKLIVLTKMRMMRWILWVYNLARSVTYVSVMPFLVLFSIMSALIHYVITLRYTFGDLTTE